MKVCSGCGVPISFDDAPLYEDECGSDACYCRICVELIRQWYEEAEIRYRQEQEYKEWLNETKE